MTCRPQHLLTLFETGVREGHAYGNDEDYTGRGRLKDAINQEADAVLRRFPAEGENIRGS